MMPRAPKEVRSILGVDPSGGRSPWGIALLERSSRLRWKLSIVREEEPEEARRVLDLLASDVEVVVIDAPIGWGRGDSALRGVDRAAIMMGGRILPPLWKGMKALSEEGLKTYFSLYEAGKVVLETHPFSASKFMEVDINEVRKAFGRHGGDAVISSVVGAAWVEGGSLVLCQEDGALVLPIVRAEIKNGDVIIFKRFKW